MEEQKREFTGVWIPRKIVEDERLSWTDRALYAEVACYETCFVSNAFLAKRIGVSVSRIKAIVGKLKELGFLKQVGFDGRRRFLSVSIPQPYQKQDTSSTENSTPEVSKTIPIDNIVDNSIDNSLDEPETSPLNQKKPEEIHPPEYYLQSSQPHIKLLGYYFRRKEIEFENPEQQKQIFEMNLKWASKITKAKYSREKILQAFDRAEQIPGKLDYNLCTIFKYLTK